MIEEPNGNSTVNVKLSSSSVIPIASSTSNDDLSQSLSASEYTDADESMSAPTEYLAEVLNLQNDEKKKHIYFVVVLMSSVLHLKINKKPLINDDIDKSGVCF